LKNKGTAKRTKPIGPRADGARQTPSEIKAVAGGARRGAKVIAGGVSAGRQMYIYIPNCVFRRIGVYLITDNGKRRDEPSAVTCYVKKEKN